MRLPPRLIPGQRLTAIDADFYNGLRELLENYDQGRLFQLDPNFIRDADDHFCTNESGAVVPIFSVLGIEEPKVSFDDNPDGFRFNWTLKCVEPDTMEGHAQNFVILMEPGREDGNLLRFCDSGSCIARVNVTDINHRFARVETGETDLQSCAAGNIRLRYLATQAGVQEMVVELHIESLHCYKTPSAGIPEATLDQFSGNVKWGNALCERYDFNLATGEDEPSGVMELVFHNMPGDIPGDKYVNTRPQQGVPVVDVQPCKDFNTGTAYDRGYTTGYGNGAAKVNLITSLAHSWDMHVDADPLEDLHGSRDLNKNGTPSIVAGDGPRGQDVMQFNNVADYWDGGAVAPWASYHTGFSFSIWVRFTSIVSGYSWIAAHRSQLNRYWDLLLDDFSSDQFRFRVWDGAGGSRDAHSSFTPVVDTWYHIVVTNDADTLSLYIDGSLHSSASDALGAIGTGNRTFRIGARPWSPHNSHRLDGDIWGLSMWDGRVLDLAAVQVLYNSGYGRLYSEY